MTQETRITGRPQVRETSRQVDLRPAAQNHGYGIAQPQGNSELEGLVRGLTAFNPALERWNKTETEDAARAGAAAAQTHEAPRDALTGAELPLPESIRPAYGKAYRDAFNEGLAQRAAVANKLEAVQEYHDLKDQPDFDATAWLAERRQKALTGVTDPRAQAIIGQHFTQLEGEVRGEVEKARMVRVEESKHESFNAMVTDALSGDQDGERMHSAFTGALQTRARELGISKVEAAQSMMLHLVGQSHKLGGAPELFDVFDVKDKDGKALVDYMPQLAPHVAQARAQAKALREHAIDQQVGQSVAKTLSQYETDVDTNPGTVTMERLLADFTPHGAFRSPQQVASMWGRAQDALRRQAGTQATLAYFDSGDLWRLEPGKQNQIMDAKMGGIIDSLSQANKAGDAQGVAAIGAKVLELHTRAGATVPFDQLKGFVSHLVTTAPSKEGPNAGFAAAAALYKSMSGAPQYRDLYFNEDVSKVMEAYTAAEKAGTDPKAAYVQAYQSVSPEAKAAADAFVKTPEFQKMVEGEVKNVTGSSYDWLKVFGFAGRPKNGDVVSAAAAQELKAWRARNPYAGTDRAKEHIDQWTAKNFVMDTVSGSAVKVPPGYAPQAVQEAISAHSAEIAKRMSLGERNDANWSVQYIPTGTEGTYQPVLFNGSATQALPPVSVQSLLDADKARKDFTPEERATIGALRKATAAGQPLPQIDTALLGKAEMLGVLKPAEVKALRDTAQKQFMERLNGVPAMTLGNPNSANLQSIPQKGNMQIDRGLTAQVARELLGTPVAGAGQNHVGYAASLVTMGEAVALRRYSDPANGAGDNIGMGYNLKANAANVRSDLKRAMVPEDRIDDVINGKADLTPDQAKRLLLVSLPRYEKQVREVANTTSPGLWERMLPAQKAVMIDIAWQTGATDKFKKAWAALASGDMKAFAEEAKVTFVDKKGVRKEDTRRNDLRASMLAGISHWDAVVGTYGAIPSTKLASLK